MRVPISWLKEFVELNISVDDLAKKLSMAGFEVESVEDLSSLADGVVVGYVVELCPHPNSKKLSVCQVDIGRSNNLQIVCGASNIKQGIYVPVAPVGVYLPTKDLQIKHAEIRGTASDGMICSLEELGIEQESKGIYIFDHIDNRSEIGSKVSSIFSLDDYVLDIAITANRPDGMSMYGIAKEVAALTNTKAFIPQNKTNIAQQEQNNNIDLGLIDSQSIYSLTLIEDIDMKGVVIDKVVNRLTKCNIQSINPVVDITNYIMLETGQPLHAFDADKLDSLSKQEVKYDDFGLRMAESGEKLSTLDNKIHSLGEKNAVITCKDKPIAIAGIMGGSDFSVSLETKRIWLESAIFNNSIIRVSSRDLAIRSEASGRYEKGVVTDEPLSVVNRAFKLFKENLKCEKISTSYTGKLIDNSLVVLLRRDRVSKMLGPLKPKEYPNNNKTARSITDSDIISDQQIYHSLESIGCIVKEIEEGWKVGIPSQRKRDLTREIDLVEEIARLIGYDNFQSFIPHPLYPGGLSAKQKAERVLRETLCSIGFNEITTMSLVGQDFDDNNRIAINNPLLSETSHLRTNLWDEHLSVCNRNLKSGSNYCWIFEIGSIYLKKNEEIEEVNKLAGLLTGNNKQGQWQRNSKNKEIDYYEARGKIGEAFLRLHLEINDIASARNKLLHPGRSAELILEGKPIGFFGQIHPEHGERLNLPPLTYIYDLDLDPLIRAATRKRKWLPTYKQYQTVPSTYRDISLLVNTDITSRQLTNIIRKAGKPLLENVVLIDRFEDEKIGNNICSLTFRMTYRGNNKTLKDEDVEPIQDSIRKELKNAFKCELKS